MKKTHDPKYHERNLNSAWYKKRRKNYMWRHPARPMVIAANSNLVPSTICMTGVKEPKIIPSAKNAMVADMITFTIIAMYFCFALLRPTFRRFFYSEKIKKGCKFADPLKNLLFIFLPTYFA